MSKIGLNWWSAATWCKAARGSLVTTSEHLEGGDLYEIIQNKNSDTEVWTATAASDSESYILKRGSGGYGMIEKKKRTNESPALCKM